VLQYQCNFIYLFIFNYFGGEMIDGAAAPQHQWASRPCQLLKAEC